MESNDNLEKKLIGSNNHIDNILNSVVNIKLICNINNRFMLDKDTMTLPSIQVTKGMLNNNIILELIKEKLNIFVSSIKDIPFSYYNNYDERYYIIKVNVEQLYIINQKYIFEDVSGIKDITVHNIITKLGEYCFNS